MNKYLLMVLLSFSPLYANDLHKAIITMDINSIRDILKKDSGAVNEVDRFGKTAVHHAAMLSVSYDTLKDFIRSRALIHGIFYLPQHLLLHHLPCFEFLLQTIHQKL